LLIIFGIDDFLKYFFFEFELLNNVFIFMIEQIFTKFQGLYKIIYINYKYGNKKSCCYCFFFYYWFAKYQFFPDDLLAIHHLVCRWSLPQKFLFTASTVFTKFTFATHSTSWSSMLPTKNKKQFKIFIHYHHHQKKKSLIFYFFLKYSTIN